MIRIEGLSDDDSDIAYIDGMHLGTMEDYYGGPNASNFLGAGSATGQTDSQFDVNVRHSSGMAANWGLVATTYEGGNSVGGDWNAGGCLFWTQSKWYHPPKSRIKTPPTAGSSTVATSFPYYPPFDWNDYPNSEDYQQWEAARARAQELDWEPSWTCLARDFDD